ncbi:hypothetical protein MASR1M45_13480 [Candidatus Kapaibacterium sp.]
MKHNLVIICCAISFAILISCGSYGISFYQVLEFESDNVKSNEKVLFYENNDIRIEYNLWSLYGTTTFSIFNKSSEDIIVDLSKSHFILNDFAQTYYQSRTFINSSSSSIGYTSQANKSQTELLLSNLFQTNSNSLGSVSQYQNSTSVSIIEEKEIIIPSKSYKIFNGFNIANDPIRSCNILRFPKSNRKWDNSKKTYVVQKSPEAMINYDKSQSPIKVKNIICYTKNKNQNINIENEFWVKNIRNVNNSDFKSIVYDEFCGYEYKKEVYNFYSPSCFYILYSYSMDGNY